MWQKMGGEGEKEGLDITITHTNMHTHIVNAVSIHYYLRIKHISINRLIEVMFVAFSVKRCKCILEDFIYFSFTTTSWSYTHQPMPNQLSFVELDDFAYLYK